MIGDHLGFEQRARFLKSNLCDLPEFGKQDQITNGLFSLRGILEQIYNDPARYSAADPLESYHNMTYTTLFLYAAGVAGVLRADETGLSLILNKTDFKKTFKKTSLLPFEALPKYGVSFRYFKNGQTVSSYKACDSFAVHFENPNTAAALNAVSENFSGVDAKTETADSIGMFEKADYSRLYLNKKEPRESADPLRKDIVRSAGGKKEVYIRLAEGLLSRRLSTACYYNRYCCPCWNVNFMMKKTMVCKLMIFDGYIVLNVPVPLKAAEEVILNRREYSPSVRNAVEKFDCIHCGKCKNEENIRLVDGVKLCSGRAEARTVYMDLDSVEDSKSIVSIIGKF